MRCLASAWRSLCVLSFSLPLEPSFADPTSFSPSSTSLKHHHNARQRQPANLIYAEILAVTSAMRKNQRWASSASSSSSYSYAYRPPSSFPSAGVGGSGQSQQQSLFRTQEQGLRGHRDGREQRPSLMSNFGELKARLREKGDGKSCSTVRRRRRDGRHFEGEAPVDG
jgi:hypothetical protein